MATIRKHTRIAKPADEVWKVVSDAGGVSDWFPVIQSSEASGNTRSCELADGTKLTEEIVTNDDELRRFQYRITEGMPSTSTSAPWTSWKTTADPSSSTPPRSNPTTSAG